MFLNQLEHVGAPRQGDVIAGKYRVEKILGQGGMGVVVAAHHLHLDQKVAIKFLLPEAFGNDEAVARFMREARAAVRIKSEYVAHVIDVGTLENGAPYIVMEYLEGGDLSAWLEQKGVLSIEQAVEFTLQACEALAEAHGLGIVHRDLKPANLYCIRRRDGVLAVKVLDFGISKVTNLAATGTASSMTRTSSVMGSPLYMSPEQLRASRDVDARTDIWSLGVILFELLTKNAPFNGEQFPEICIKIVNDPTPSVRSYRPDVSAELENVIEKCLSKDRTQRYWNVADLSVALLPFAPKRARASVERVRGIVQSFGLSTSSLALPPSSDIQVEQHSGQTDVAWGHTAAASSGPKRWTVLAIVCVVAALGLAVLAYTKTRAQPAADRSAATSTPTQAAAALASVTTNQTPTSRAAGTSATEPNREPAVTGSSAPVAVMAKADPAQAAPRSASSSARTSKQLFAKRKESDAQSPKPASPDCNPPFTQDGDGRKHFKPECF